jgi:hypothetical protein
LLEVEFCCPVLAVERCWGEAEEGFFIDDIEGVESTEAEDAGAGFFVKSSSMPGEVLGTGGAFDVVEEVGGE